MYHHHSTSVGPSRMVPAFTSKHEVDYDADFKRYVFTVLKRKFVSVQIQNPIDPFDSAKDGATPVLQVDEYGFFGVPELDAELTDAKTIRSLIQQYLFAVYSKSLIECPCFLADDLQADHRSQCLWD